MLRRKARELCLQILFQKEFNSEFKLASSINYFKQHHNMAEDVLDYASNLASGVIENLDKIDQLINSHSKNWKTSRMSSVDLNILRMSLLEALFLQPANEPKVVINEALEIAKKYSSLDSHSFINGILDQVIRTQLGDFNS